MSAPALEAKSLKLAWGDLLVAEDISLHVDEGEIVCIVGRSGCGKSTLFHALAGLDAPAEGRVILHGEDITGVPGRVSYMLQKDLLLPNLTILNNTALPLVLGGMKRDEARRKAQALFATFGLEGTEENWPAQLSGGMRQRAALLRTYLMNNDVVLLDEPFSALDAITRVELRRWFASMVEELELSALVITHDVDEAINLGSRVYVLEGRPMQGWVSRLSGEVDVHAMGAAAAREKLAELLGIA